MLTDSLRKMRARLWCGVAGCPVGDHSKFLRPVVTSSGMDAGPPHHLGVSLLLSNLSPICILRTAVCSLAALPSQPRLL